MEKIVSQLLKFEFWLVMSVPGIACIIAALSGGITKYFTVPV
ncbi:MAG TPA: hypothetical protein VK588_05425 [Chitinophagaceae bacterium]|nr:hypothetical protein [Chitinophagaceae bacterium]